jgi:hypothetical protein
MVHLRSKEGVHGVAFLAIRGEPVRGVIRLRSLVVLCMAGDAVSGKSEILSGCRALVTGLTVQCGMSSQQRKTIAMLLDRLEVDLPTLYGMTLLAIGTKLPAMEIRVAVGASRSGIAENETGVTLNARDVLV